MSYAHPPQSSIARRHFARHLARQLGYCALIVGGSLAIGSAGYHWIGGLGWVDALLNTAMLLGGMGPVDPLRTTAAKLFAAIFALYSGLVFLAVAGLLIAPVFSRVLHRFHWETKGP